MFFIKFSSKYVWSSPVSLKLVFTATNFERKTTASWICNYSQNFQAMFERLLHKKMKFSIKDLSSKCDQIRRKLQKSLIESFIFSEVGRLNLIMSKLLTLNKFLPLKCLQIKSCLQIATSFFEHTGHF